MDEIVLPLKWHSFCVSIDVALQVATVVHNDHIQVVQRLQEIEGQTSDENKFMTKGHLGGSKFEGSLTAFEVFGRPMSTEELLQWTSCRFEVIFFLTSPVT